LERAVQQRLSEAFPRLETEFDSISLVQTQGIALSGLRFYEPVENGKKLRAAADELFIQLPLKKIFSRKGRPLEPERLLLKHPTVYIEHFDSDSVQE